MAPAIGNLWRPAIVVGAATALLVALGVWQLERRAWKQELIDRVGSRATQPAAELPRRETWDTLDPDEIDYGRVRVTGTFRHNAEVHLYTSLANPKGRLGGPGFFVLSPLELTDGSFVFVNRGFVPVRNKPAMTRVQGQVSGPVVVEGLLRRPQWRSWATPADDVAQNVWFTRDPDAMAVARGLPEDKVAPFTIDADKAATPPGGLPQAGETIVQFTDNHLQYALTWFGLAAACIIVFVAAARTRPGLAGERVTAPPPPRGDRT